MDLFWKSVAATLVSVILGFTLGKWERNFSLLMSVILCCMVGTVVVSFLVPVIDMMMQLETLCNLGERTLQILLKIVGIGFMGEFVSLICADSGNSAMAKMITLLTNAVILWLSIPIINQFFDMLKQILGTI